MGSDCGADGCVAASLVTVGMAVRMPDTRVAISLSEEDVGAVGPPGSGKLPQAESRKTKIINRGINFFIMITP